jgi:hypothetical protein
MLGGCTLGSSTLGAGCASSASIGAPVLALELDTYRIGQAGFWLDLDTYSVGSASLALELQTFRRGFPLALLDLDTYILGQAQLALSLYVGMLLGKPVLPMQFRTFAKGHADLDLELRTVEPPAAPGSQPAHVWSLSVSVNGAQQAVTGQVVVDAEEGSARVAHFSVYGPPAFGIGASVLIDIAATSGSGRLFTGEIDEPQYDPRQRVTTYQCSDPLKRRIDKLTREQIDLLTPGAAWSADVDNSDSQGWDYFQQRMESTPASYELDAYGMGRLTAWSAGAMWPTISKALDNSESIDLARADTLRNRIVISADYRWVRLAKRLQEFSWVPWYSLCEYLQQTLQYPLQSMIEQAADGTGWDVEDMATIHPPPSEFLLCNSEKIGWVISPERRQQLVVRASLTLGKRFSRAMQAGYSITLEAPESITRHGVYMERSSASLAVDYDDSTWRDGTDDAPGSAATDPNGDEVYDQGDDARFALWMQTVIAQARTQILSAHRQTTVQIDVPIAPDIGCHHRVPIDIPAITSTGKLIQCVHTIDVDAGRAVTTLKQAISEGGGADGNLSVPDSPDSAAIGTLSAPSQRVDLGTHIGGQQSSPLYDDSWDGYIGNATYPYPGSQIYDVAFKIKAPELDNGLQDSADISESPSYQIGVPDDQMIIH